MLTVPEILLLRGRRNDALSCRGLNYELRKFPNGAETEDGPFTGM
ncbi:hypothetical protein GMO_09680 [Gluconobacter morbifer G707]|uniref:Uncharacterized protein n=1 Tax=Gluconobacter morbifer G707 TaxID=1088869 RepID=G6XHK2_9PROT|nr:hypothetical protein GMO_09680 [Gluconobacter morbifer G707]